MNDVVFRRINGHIVPIKIGSKERIQKAKEGSSQVAGAAAVGIGTGVAASHLVKQANEVTKASRSKFKAATGALKSMKLGQLTFDDAATAAASNQAIKKAVKMRFGAAKAFGLRNRLLFGGATVATALLAAGIPKLQEAITGEKKKGVGKSEIFTVAASVGTYAAYYKHLNVGGIGNIIRNTAARFRGMPRPHQASWF